MSLIGEMCQQKNICRDKQEMWHDKNMCEKLWFVSANNACKPHVHICEDFAQFHLQKITQHHIWHFNDITGSHCAIYLLWRPLPFLRLHHLSLSGLNKKIVLTLTLKMLTVYYGAKEPLEHKNHREKMTEFEEHLFFSAESHTLFFLKLSSLDSPHRHQHHYMCRFPWVAIFAELCDND